MYVAWVVAGNNSYIPTPTCLAHHYYSTTTAPLLTVKMQPSGDPAYVTVDCSPQPTAQHNYSTSHDTLYT